MSKQKSTKLNITKEDFLAKMQELHGDDYELIGEFIDHLTEVDIFCNKKDFARDKHGIFKARPIDIMKNTIGCPVCGGTKKSNTEEWIKKANYVHNGYFIYDEKTQYKGSNNLITVKCPIHGYFEVMACRHLYGSGCPKCIENGLKHSITRLPKINASTSRLTTEEVKERILQFHPEYDVSKVDYKNNRSKIILICPEHGEFEITAAKALIGRGCRKCAKNFPKTTKMFIKESKQIHGETAFDYKEAVYKGNHVKVKLKCNKCGYEFEVEPGNHTTFGQGCPRCASSKMERDIALMLEREGIKFISQYSEKLEGLRADFYLPEYNVAIECQGAQHFKPIKFKAVMTDEECFKNFELQIERDNKKYNLLKEQGIDLLYYTNLDINDYRYPLIKDKKTLLTEILSRK